MLWGFISMWSACGAAGLALKIFFWLSKGKKVECALIVG